MSPPFKILFLFVALVTAVTGGCKSDVRDKQGTRTILKSTLLDSLLQTGKIVSSPNVLEKTEDSLSKIYVENYRSFRDDSLFLVAAKQKWYVLFYSESYNQANFAIQLYPSRQNESLTTAISTFYQPSSYAASPHGQQISGSTSKRILEILDSIKVLPPANKNPEDYLLCGNTKVFYFDGNKYYILHSFYNAGIKELENALAVNPVFKGKKKSTPKRKF